jgi:hypothetical protein
MRQCNRLAGYQADWHPADSAALDCPAANTDDSANRDAPVLSALPLQLRAMHLADDLSVRSIPPYPVIASQITRARMHDWRIPRPRANK